MSKTRVLVVEDSLTTRKHLISVLSADPDFEITGEAADGKQAIEMCQALRPDVMTLDMMLPVMTGVAVTEYVMAYCPTPILVVSASLNRGELHKTYDALAAGAVDVLDKPTGNQSDDDWERRFVSAVKMVSRIRVITHIRGRLGAMARTSTVPPYFKSRDSEEGRKIIAIGASTGGPSAIVEILRELPPAFQIPILLVIHISEPFGPAFAGWLDGQSKISVRYAIDGERLPSIGQAGVIMAPAGQHMVVEYGRLRLTSAAERNSCRPSIDVLFESLAKEVGSQTVACLLTGMGRDGAAGMLALRQAGALTFAQDEATSVVFGMPKEAIHLGGASRVLALGEFAPALAALSCETEVRQKQ